MSDRLDLARQSYRAYETGDRNTEVLTFRGERICRAEVYFGWDLHPAR